MTPNFIFYIYIYKQHFHLHCCCCFWCCRQHQHRHLSTVRHEETRSFEHSHGTLSHQSKSTLPPKVPPPPSPQAWVEDFETDSQTWPVIVTIFMLIFMLSFWFCDIVIVISSTTNNDTRQKKWESLEFRSWWGKKPQSRGANFHFGLWSRK